MRNGQNKHHRMRGRNRSGGGGKNHNPLTRVYESNGPDVKIRGTANHVAEKYIQLARDATASGDPVAAENYYQHAEHYFRLIAAAQEQFRQSQPFQQQQPRQEGNDENFDGDDDAQPSSGEPHYTPREQPYPQQRDFQHRQHNNQPRHERNDQPRQERGHERAQQQPGNNDGDVGGLPSFITGAQSQQNQPAYGQNGHEGQGGQPDRFPLNRRRRRHRGPSQDAQGGEGAGDSAPAETQSGE
jgi:hypothetical protein